MSDPRHAVKDPIPAFELRHLRVFVALVDTGSMTAAARQLGVSQSTVSEALAALERALGTAVAARRRGRDVLSLTETGTVLLPHARRVLASLEQAHAEVIAAANDARARVQVIANESVTTYLLPAALARLRVARPKTRFIVAVGMCPAIREGVARRTHDLGFVLEQESQPGHRATGLTARSLGPVRLVLFGRVDHPLANRRRAVERAELALYPVYSSDASGDFHAMLSSYLHGSGIPGPRLESTGSVEAVKRIVADDPRALGVLPDYALAEELASRSACEVALLPSLPSMRLDALLSARAAALPAATELVESLRELVHSPARRPTRRRSAG